MSESQEPEQTAPASSGGGVVSPSSADQQTERPPELAATQVPTPLERELGKQREETRQTATVFLLFIFLLLLIGAGIAAFVGGEVWTNYEEFFRLALPAITGLLGAAIGFYFGGQK